MLVLAEVALAAAKGTVLTQSQHGVRLRKRTKLSTMEKNTIGAVEIITAVVLNTMGFMLIIRLVITMRGDPKWMNIVLPGIKTRSPTRHYLTLQMIQIKSLLSSISFVMHFVLRRAFLLKQLIESGKTLRETSRSKSQVE
jgi:hypothetical protein